MSIQIQKHFNNLIRHQSQILMIKPNLKVF